MIATCGYDGTVRLRDAAQDRERLTLRGHRDCVDIVAFTAGGRCPASTSDDGSVKIWNTETGDELISFRGHGDGVHSVTFSADDKRLIVGGYDGTVKVWDAAATPEALTLTGAPSRVSAVAFSPDGRTVVAGGLDRKLRVWDVRTGRLIATRSGHNQLTPDSHRPRRADFPLPDRRVGYSLRITTKCVRRKPRGIKELLLRYKPPEPHRLSIVSFGPITSSRGPRSPRLPSKRPRQAVFALWAEGEGNSSR